MIEKLKELHALVISLGALVSAVGMFVPVSSSWHLKLVGAGGAITAGGGWLARLWQPADIKAAVAAQDGAK